MQTINLIINIEPRGQKRDRIASFGGHARSYKDKSQSDYEAKVAALIAQYKPPRPIEGAIELDVKAFLPIPVSRTKKFKTMALQGLIRPTGKPDMDNLLKQCDIMTGVFFRDDAQIVRASVEKWYSDCPRWEIKLSYEKQDYEPETDQETLF